MALTANTILDIAGNAQNIIFSNPGTVDEIDFSGTNITLKAMSTLVLSKANFNLYFSYIVIYQTALLFNFPILANQNISILPASKFNLKPQNPTVILLEFLSGATQAVVMTYDLVAKTITFTARASDVVITMQEFFMYLIMLRQFQNQISLQ